jgi:hypothetical protein
MYIRNVEISLHKNKLVDLVGLYYLNVFQLLYFKIFQLFYLNTANCFI